MDNGSEVTFVQGGSNLGSVDPTCSAAGFAEDGVFSDSCTPQDTWL